MGKLNQPQVVQASAQRFSLRQQEKFVRDYGSGRNPRVFELNGVVDTPRRAGASIGEGVDNDIAPVSELLDKIRSGAGHFSSLDELNTLVPLFQ